MRYFFYLVSLTTLFCCESSPNYNPFDEQFDISLRTLKGDGIDTIGMECGFITMEQAIPGRLKVYYQTHYDFNINKDEVVAKGFNYYLDTLYNIPYSKKRKDSLNKVLIDLSVLNQSLRTYGYYAVEIDKKYRLINNRNNDTLVMSLFNKFDVKESKVIREFSFFNQKK